MSANLMTIDVSSVMSAQMSSANSVSESVKTDSGLNAKNTSANKKSLVTSALRDGEAQSHNIGTDAQKALVNSGFQNVLKQQLKKDESAGQTVEATVVTKTKKAGVDGKLDQAQSLIVLQSSVISGTEQKQTTVDSKSGSSSKSGQVLTTTNSSKNVSESTAVLEGRQKNQRDVAQQIVAIQTSGVQKGDAKTDTMPAGSQAGENIAALNSRSSGTTAKTNTTSNPQQASPAKSPDLIKNQVHESIDSKNQLSQAQSKVQFADISAAANITNQLTQLTSTSTTTDKTNNIKLNYTDRLKDKSSGEKQKANNAAPVDKNTSGQKESLSTDKLNIEKIDVVETKAGSQKSQQNTGVQQSFNNLISTADSAQAVAVNRTVITDRAAATAQNGSESNPASPFGSAEASTATEIRDQIFQSIRTSIQQGQQQVTISLHPPELGRISIKFSQQGDKVTGVLEATNPQTRAEIRQAIPEIIRSLEESGISVKRLDVTLSDSSDKSDLSRQSANDSMRENVSQELWGQYGHHGFQDTAGERSLQNGFVTPAYNGDSADLHGEVSSGAEQSAPSNNLLDVLI